jgi:hypothetical protein|tara:strand:- start:20000 stop:20263 length:264 start_codon:yes stop_codon:yes gene_type:complete
MEEKEVKRMIDEAIRQHEHEGSLSKQIQIENIFGLIKTIDDTTDLANVVAETPRDLYEQIFIDTSTATKKLYIFDTVGSTWYSVTIT